MEGKKFLGLKLVGFFFWVIRMSMENTPFGTGNRIFRRLEVKVLMYEFSNFACWISVFAVFFFIIIIFIIRLKLRKKKQNKRKQIRDRHITKKKSFYPAKFRKSNLTDRHWVSTYFSPESILLFLKQVPSFEIKCVELADYN